MPSRRDVWYGADSRSRRMIRGVVESAFPFVLRPKKEDTMRTRQGGRRRRRELVGVVVFMCFVVGAGTLGVSGAAAAVTCSFASGTVTVAMDPGDSATIVVAGTAIEVNGAGCNGARVNTTTAVVVNGSTGSES